MIQQQELIVGGIVTTIISKGNYENLMFCLHGRLGSAKEFIDKYTSFLERLVTIKTALVLFDHRNHGTRLVSEIQNQGKTLNPTHSVDMYSIQLGTAMDVSFLIDTIPLYRNVKKWGIIGFSLGGHAALLAMSLDDRFMAGVSIVGCGDYNELMLSRGIELSKSLSELVLKRDPINNVNQFAGKHIMMLHGELDSLVPKSANFSFAKKLEIAVGNSGSVAFIVDPIAKHEISELMMVKACECIHLHFG
jgi:pimeloyl-ACP methyl ester carboxylesterase